VARGVRPQLAVGLGHARQDRAPSAASQSCSTAMIGVPIVITISLRCSHSPARSSERVPTRNTGMNARFKELQQCCGSREVAH
jgi:hypothetical protein